MYIVRRWATRNSRPLEIIYHLTARFFHALDPLWVGFGIGRLERPFAALEASTKGFLFDCRMCGRCKLSVTGMTCVMNCPKTIANGPCGGVRANGNCEVIPEMECVWVQAFDRSQQMPNYGHEIINIQPPVNQSLKGSSAWINMLQNTDTKHPAGWIIPAETISTCTKIGN